ncbi:MAG: hypothetical protein PHZ07_04445 [Patescibacteria group bacterium]|nr:hypothetical protein [Patescibacteria group bacterium]MDD4303997.1 hypothetical protein [Patescibacteria group bacterium]MDD4695014.1 hypothetical protein [Patescibacteria group bacterium]
MRKQTVKKQTVSESRTYLKPWMLIVSVLVVAVLVGAVIYSGQQSIVKDKDENLKKSESRIKDLSSQLTQMEEYIRTNMVQKEEEKKPENIVYTNSKSGFSMEFPKTWGNYIAKDRQLKFGVIGSTDSVDFYFDENSPVFNIAMIDKSIWDSVKDLSYYTPTKIQENDKYVVAYSIPKGVDEDFIASKQEDINIILNSFTILEPSNIDTDGVNQPVSNITPSNPEPVLE